MNYDQAQAAAIANGQTAKVKVYAPCDCYACKRGDRWFYCVNAARPVVEYMCAPKYEDCDAVPHDAAVAEIRAKHPGCSLVYVD